MVQQFKKFDNNVLALLIARGFTKVDEKFCQKLFENILDMSLDQVNVFIKIDEINLRQSSVKALFEDMAYTLKNYKSLRHIAIVAHSKILKSLVPVDALFFENTNKGRSERYYDISQINEAFEFVGNEKWEGTH